MEDTSNNELEDIKERSQVALQTYLDENYKLVRALRAHDQYYAAANLELWQEMRKFLNSQYDTEFRREPIHALCEVTREGVLIPHDQEFFDSNNTIRGFFFQTTVDIGDRILGIGCVDLDSGLSRKLFDEMSKDERRQFLGKVLQNPVTIIEDKPRPLIQDQAIAFVADKGGKYVIEEMVVSPELVDYTPS